MSSSFVKILYIFEKKKIHFCLHNITEMTEDLHDCVTRSINLLKCQRKKKIKNIFEMMITMCSSTHIHGVIQGFLLDDFIKFQLLFIINGLNWNKFSKPHENNMNAKSSFLRTWYMANKIS